MSLNSTFPGEVLVYKDEVGAGDDVRDASSEEVGSPRAEALMEVEEMEPEEVIGPSLGRVLGVLSVIVLVFYALGMGYKLYKIWKGEYVEEEPVFLKYK